MYLCSLFLCFENCKMYGESVFDIKMHFSVVSREKKTPQLLVRKRIILTEWPPHFIEFSANVCGWRVLHFGYSFI
jgi:hypothetical protein